MWEDKRLRDVTEADVQQLVNSGLEEHLQLEYKSALYDGNDQGSRESLLDICMFANAGGGIADKYRMILGANDAAFTRSGGWLSSQPQLERESRNVKRVSTARINPDGVGKVERNLRSRQSRD
jgi:hypothetical protein